MSAQDFYGAGHNAGARPGSNTYNDANNGLMNEPPAYPAATQQTIGPPAGMQSQMPYSTDKYQPQPQQQQQWNSGNSPANYYGQAGPGPAQYPNYGAPPMQMQGSGVQGVPPANYPGYTPGGPYPPPQWANQPGGVPQQTQQTTDRGGAAQGFMGTCMAVCAGVLCADLCCLCL